MNVVMMSFRYYPKYGQLDRNPAVTNSNLNPPCHATPL